MSLRTSAKIALRTWPKELYPLLPDVKDRRFHAYCVGLPRSGTHSMARVFSGGYRAAHEPRSPSTLYMMTEYIKGNIEDRGLASFLLMRDKQLSLATGHFLRTAQK